MKKYRQLIWLIVGLAVTAGMTESVSTDMPPPTAFDKAMSIESLPKTAFTWRAMWVHHADLLASDRITNLVSAAARMHVNVLIAAVTAGGSMVCYNSEFYRKPAGVLIDPLAELIHAAKARNIQVYAWTINLRPPCPAYLKNHPELLQKIQLGEEASIRMPRVNPDRVNAHGGEWLCPDRGLDPEEARFLSELFAKYDLDGVAFDYLGYRNYYACFCDYSCAERAKFAGAHPELNDREVLRQYSESRLVEWTRQAQELLLKIKPDLKIAVHIYPDFDLNPFYGAKLHVDYCGQTVAWFYKPFWPEGKVLELAKQYQSESGKYRRGNHFVPFVGVAGGENLKAPEQLRREIRLAGSVGAPGIMLAFFETFRDNPALAAVVADEFAP